MLRPRHQAERSVELSVRTRVAPRGLTAKMISSPSIRAPPTEWVPEKTDSAAPVFMKETFSFVSVQSFVDVNFIVSH